MLYVWAISDVGATAILVANEFVDMVKSCAAYNCTNRFVKGSGIHFFK